ncbi:MAG: hypothetical protein JSS56_00320 [Proteobacteria bacterium]|nr:hypothetical protein [Pseudomonadota bacterium]
MSKIHPLSLATKAFGRPLVLRLLYWLQHGWRTRCARAERPRRRVPYY